jgi:hypothetical protein
MMIYNKGLQGNEKGREEERGVYESIRTRYEAVACFCFCFCFWDVAEHGVAALPPKTIYYQNILYRSLVSVAVKK